MRATTFLSVHGSESADATNKAVQVVSRRRADAIHSFAKRSRSGKKRCLVASKQTCCISSRLKRMTHAGVEVYVGGCKVGMAVKKYGTETWVTHVFTANATVLNAPRSQPLPYFADLRAAAE